MFGYTMKTGYTNLAIFYFFFPPHFWRLKTSKIAFFSFEFLISLSGDISPVKKG
jgi:hypothetical protein